MQVRGLRADHGEDDVGEGPPEVLSHRARPFEPYSRPVLGAILWALIAKSYQNLQKLTFD